MRSGVRGFAAAALPGCLLATLLASLLASLLACGLSAGSAAASGSGSGGSGSDSHVSRPQSVALGPGLSSGERQALQRSGAYGAHPVRVLLLGDSIAMTLGTGLAEDAQAAYGVTIEDFATLGCDLDPQLVVRTEGVAGPATAGCESWRALWPFLTAAQHPQVVALGLGRWEVADHRLDGHWVHVGEPAWDQHVASDLRSAIAIFREFGARVVLLTMPFVDPSSHQPDGLPWAEDSPMRTRAFNAIVWRVAGADPTEVGVIDVNRMLSPDGDYTASIGGVAVRWPDGIHVTTAAGQLLQPQILPQFDRIGLDEEAAARAHV